MNDSVLSMLSGNRLLSYYTSFLRGFLVKIQLRFHQLLELGRAKKPALVRSLEGVWFNKAYPNKGLEKRREQAPPRSQTPQIEQHTQQQT